jgi:hypothetical protein
MFVLVKNRSHKPGTDEWRNGEGKVMRVGRCEMDLNMKICALVSANCNIFLSFSSPFVVTYTKKYAQCSLKTVYMAKSHEVKVSIPTYILMNSHILCPAPYCVCIIANCVWRALMFSVGLWQLYINITVTVLGLIHRPVFYLTHDVSETEYSVYWSQPSIFHLETETEFSFRNVVSNKRQDVV